MGIQKKEHVDRGDHIGHKFGKYCHLKLAGSVMKYVT